MRKLRPVRAHSPAALAQTPTTSQTPAAPKSPDEPDEGIPITSPAVKKACGGCHAADDKQRLSRISFRRATPEGWQETIRRMVTLNGASLEPADAREVVKYLADHLGLAPEEVSPAAFELERRHAKFIPRYAMVMFHPEISYAEARRRGTVQAEILDDLTQEARVLGDVDFERAAALIAERL